MEPLKNLELAGLCGVLFEQSTDGLILLDLDSDRCLEANRKALRMTGLTREQLRNRTSSQLLIATISGPNQRQRWQVQHSDGRRLRIRLKRTHLPPPFGSLVLCRLQRPTRSKRSERAASQTSQAIVVKSVSDRETRADVRDSLAKLVPGVRSPSLRQQLLASVVDACTDYVAVRSLTGVYLAGNRAFAEFVGLPVTEVVGRSDHELFSMPGARLFAEQFDRCAHSGQPLQLKQVMDRPRRPSTLIEWRIDPVTSPDGVVTMFVVSGRDAGPVPSLSDEELQANKLEALGQLAGGVAHDFNNILTAILGNITLLQSSIPKDHPDAELLADTERAAWRAAKLTGQLLLFARKQPLVNELVDLNLVSQEVASLLRRTIDSRVNLQLNLHPEPLPIMGDPSRLNQMLMNLCINARDAMPDGGLIEISTLPIAPQNQQDQQKPQWVSLRVRDTGTGMPPEVLARIYEPFFTTKPPGQGTGLGLATVYKIVQQLQGAIECRSTVGQGTTFELRFPMVNESYTPTVDNQPPVAKSEPPGQAATILLVDDEPFNCTLGKAILEHEGYQVVFAEDGQQAVDFFREQSSQVDLVLLDLNMPGLSGRETLQAIRQLNPQIPILVLSGYSSETLTSEFLNQIQGFVNKPYRPKDLLASIRFALNQPHPPA